MQTETNNNATAKPKERLRSASRSTLTPASAITDSEVFKESIKLLREAAKLRAQVSQAEERLDQIKEYLSGVCGAYDLKGLKYGLAGFEYHGWTARATFSKEAAVELGIDPAVVAQCYRKGKEYLDAKFVLFDVE
jgi:hypothetical protein